MTLTKKQINKRNEMINDAVEYFMNGWNSETSTRNSLSKEDAVYKVESLLSNEENLRLFNALAASFSK